MKFKSFSFTLKNIEVFQLVEFYHQCLLEFQDGPYLLLIFFLWSLSVELIEILLILFRLTNNGLVSITTRLYLKSVFLKAIIIKKWIFFREYWVFKTEILIIMMLQIKIRYFFSLIRDCFNYIINKNKKKFMKFFSYRNSIFF